MTNWLSKDFNEIVIITAGEEGFFKIWDGSCKSMIQKIDVRIGVSIKDLRKIRSYGVQALDVFPCDKNYPSSLGKVKILAGVRSGDVVECHVDFNREFYTAEDVMNDKKMPMDEKEAKL